MLKVLKLIFFFSFYSAPVLINAQQKFAVLVGINDYFKAPGVKSESSLSGCVNDAKSIKGLLENRFGFSPANIFTLYNAAATKRKVIDQLQVVLHKCAPGDAVVFYFSGHGVWMTNNNFDDDPVKRGMSQAIVMSDLYSPGWDCLVRDETLKNIFNQFIDKKIVFTSIFDCCYSGNLPMMPLTTYWYGFEEAKDTVKDISIHTIPYNNRVVEPVGCLPDTAGTISNSPDSDRDGVPDCADWEINTNPMTRINVSGVGIEPPFGDRFIYMKDNYYDSTRFASNSAVPDTISETRSFNLKDALTATNQSSVRPSGRKNSRFLNLSGAADNRMGLEIRGLSGRKQGAFTAALLDVYRRNSPGITVTELKKKITAIMDRQGYGQTPMYHHEPSRLNGNLIGIAPQGFSNKTRAKCISIKDGFITLDKGWNDGIEKGNILGALNLPGNPIVQVVEVYDASAKAIDKSRGKIMPGQMVELRDPYTVSAPHIKICIPSALFTPDGYESFFNQQIIPESNEKGYTDYYFEPDQVFNGLVWWEDSKKVHRIPHLGSNENGGYAFAVLLPVPSYVAERLKSILKKDQNIEIVTDPRSADLVLYLNYVKKRPGIRSGFVFYFHPPIFVSPQGRGNEIFSGQHVMIPSMNISGTKLQSLAKQLHGIARGSIRGKTTAWINLDDRR